MSPRFHGAPDGSTDTLPRVKTSSLFNVPPLSWYRMAVEDGQVVPNGAKPKKRLIMHAFVEMCMSTRISPE